MTRALPRTRLNTSQLTRFLTENAMIDAALVVDDVGPKLGDWLNFRQAISLHSALNAEQQPAPPQPAHLQPAWGVAAQALARHVDKVRAQLEQSIVQGAPSGSGLSRIDMPAAELDEPIDLKTAYEPYRRFYTAHQRQMQASLKVLRSQVRGQLSKGAPKLRLLASLDAVFESVLSEREAILLGKVAKLQEKCFTQTLKKHLQHHSHPQAEATIERAETAPVVAVNSLSWLLPLRQAMRTALMAELDTRLQPVLGLVEAFNQYIPQEQ